mgnify:CR=1 FL=1
MGHAVGAGYAGNGDIAHYDSLAVGLGGADDGAVLVDADALQAGLLVVEVGDGAGVATERTSRMS